MIRLFPSLMASNLLTLEKTLHQLRDVCSGFHVDIMDGQFVPNLAFSIDMVNAIRSATPLSLWTHLMVFNPTKYVEKLALKEYDIVSIHYESAPLEELKVIFRGLQDSNVVASCALQPQTPVSVLHDLIGYINHVHIMSVHAGFSGQQFLPGTVSKLKELEAFQENFKTSLGVGVDGGINLATIQEALSASVTEIALGSSVFFGNKPEEKLEQFSKII
ncbi:MAG: ribulose-phosphate 3-epimerase [Candidatus Babeliaceae bacterium]|nr:ribulose-phosphate 3-epimerase [Candidatus Babeliaceae bacterium]